MKTGDLYRHFKGGEYVILAIANLESTKGTENEQKLVIYQSKEKKTIWARPMDNFTEVLDREGKSVLRFEPLNDFDIVTFDQYEDLALRTAGKHETQERALNYGGLGVGGEAGEFQGALVELIELCLDSLRSGKHSGNVTDYIKKVLFHDHPLTLEKIENEQGDKLWYDNRVLHAIGSSLKTAAKMNILKLMKRYPDGFSKERSKNRKEELGA
jgi:hypothetical protein